MIQTTGRKAISGMQQNLIQVTAAVIRRDGEILLCGRAPGSRYAECMEFPGGKLEPGETLSECLKRELREELGAEVYVMDLIHVERILFGEKTLQVNFFRTALRRESPPPHPREGQPMRWTSVVTLDMETMLPGDRHLAELLAAAEKNRKKNASAQ